LDGRLMALEMAPGVIHLKEVATGRTVAKLEDPHGDRATWQGFTPDGTQLVVLARHTRAIHIWDLREIRSRLKDMKLDWDWPEFPKEATGDGAAEPLMIDVLPGAVAKAALIPEQTPRRAIERDCNGMDPNPDSARPCNNLALFDLTAREALRDVGAALPLAKKAEGLLAENAGCRNRLGMSNYRAVRYSRAVPVLRPNLEHQPDTGLTYDLYALAMSRHRPGEIARARDYYDSAVRPVQMQRGLDPRQLEELTSFRAVAEQLLGIDCKKQGLCGVVRPAGN
jgi:hypothetical protein